MDRRDSIKALLVGTVSTGILLEACDTADKKAGPAAGTPEATDSNADRMKEEIAYNKKLRDEKFFNDHEMETIGVLCGIIIPKDEVSGGATEAKVPEFIEFIVKDQPSHQTPMRGGLKWLDMHCMTLHGETFAKLDDTKKIAVVDSIAYPRKAKKELSQGVNFFNLIRNLTVTGFYTSEIGIKDLGYVGNRPNQWNGVPADVLKQYNMAYTEKELKECISFG